MMSWKQQGGGPWGSSSGGNGGDGSGGGSGGGGNGRGPFGPGGSGPQPPDLEEILRKGQDTIRKFIPGGVGSGRGILFLVLIAIALWLASGFYRVSPSEQGAVLRFGKWSHTTGPGLHYHLPSPIEAVEIPNVTRINRVEVGFRSVSEFSRDGAQRDITEESLMLTGDQNIVDIDFTVFWRINDAGKFLFNIRNPEPTVKVVAESAMREVIGQTPIQDAFTEGRDKIEQATRSSLQRLLDEYGAGIEVTQVQLLKVDPPSQVIDAFNDVQRARQDQERTINQSEAYARDIVPRARGESERDIQAAHAYKEEIVNRAEGEASRFLKVYESYKVAKDVTVQRIYLETMEKVFADMNKVVIDSKGAGSGVVPYLPLDQLAPKPKKSADQGVAQ